MIPGTILNITLDTKSDSDYFLIIAVFLFRVEVFHNILSVCIYKAQEKQIGGCGEKLRFIFMMTCVPEKFLVSKNPLIKRIF